MKEQSLYELIGELRERSQQCIYLSKQRIVDYAVSNYSKLLTGKEVIAVCKILLQNITDTLSLDENIDLAVYDYIHDLNK